MLGSNYTGVVDKIAIEDGVEQLWVLFDEGGYVDAPADDWEIIAG